MKSSSQLTTILKPYKTGWVALDKDETKVLAHAPDFSQINEKVADYDPSEIVLFPLGSTRSYFIG